MMSNEIDLTTFDMILINSSGGKDSQVMLDLIASQAEQAGVKDRVIVFHADLGRVEWPGTAALAEEQAKHYGLRFEKQSRIQGDLLHHIEQRGMFPDAARRYCTSDHKRDQGRKMMTRLVNELGLSRPARILNCMGFRWAESPSRAKKVVFRKDESASNKTKRHVFEYCPILEWTEKEIWNRISESGVRHHWAYDAGMPRLSCCFCVLASRGALIRAAQLSPDLAAEYARVEQTINHRFRNDLTMAEIIYLAKSQSNQPIENWAA